MGKNTGFKEFSRATVPYRNAADRLLDYREIYTAPEASHLQTQGARCMDCGVPFCQSDHGCPISNLIPEWNDLVYRGDWHEALHRLHKTNNFPEFTGRVCPAPCEGACVLGITDPAVTIKNIESAIIDKGFEAGWVQANPPSQRTDKTIAIVGSGPCGLAAAAQLNQAGHRVTVHERSDRLGGLLMYGIPNMKLDKYLIERRIQLMKDEGVIFQINSDIGSSTPLLNLVRDHDAVLLATGSSLARDLDIEGREGPGVHLAMEFLTASTKSLLDSNFQDGNPISANDKNVIVIGGGDTGTDCIATSLRHGCKSLVNFEILAQPPEHRAENNPWPLWPVIHRLDYGHTESAHLFGKDPRVYSVLSKKILRSDNGTLTGIVTVDVDHQFNELPGSQRHWQADMILLSMGFLQPEHYPIESVALRLDNRGNFEANNTDFRTSIEKVYAAADCRRGQDLVVRAINEGRQAARSIDTDLMGSSQLP